MSPSVFSSVAQVVSDSLRPHESQHARPLSITNSWSLLKLMSIKSVMSSSHLILCCPPFLLPPVPASTRVFSNESTLCMRWPKYWSFSFSISPSNEHPGVISFRMDWLGLNEVKSLSRVQLFVTLWTVAYQAPWSMEFSRQKYWSGFPFPSPGIFPTQG